MGEGEGKDKLYNGLNEARTKARADLRNDILRRRREPNAHPIYELILKDELMKHAKHARIIDLPAPFDKPEAEWTNYCSIYQEEIEKQFLVSFQERSLKCRF